MYGDGAWLERGGVGGLGSYACRFSCHHNNSCRNEVNKIASFQFNFSNRPFGVQHPPTQSGPQFSYNFSDVLCF